MSMAATGTPTAASAPSTRRLVIPFVTRLLPLVPRFSCATAKRLRLQPIADLDPDLGAAGANSTGSRLSAQLRVCAEPGSGFERAPHAYERGLAEAGSDQLERPWHARAVKADR